MKTPFLATLLAGLFSLSSASAAVQVFSYGQLARAGGPAVSWSADGHVQHGVGPTPYTPTGMTTYISTTIEIDTATSMIRAYGSSGPLSFTWSGSSTLTWQTGTLPPMFPNPNPTPVYDSATINVTMTIDVASFSFDSGFRPYAWDGVRWAFDGPIEAATTGTVTVGHSITRGSETSSGSAQFLNIPFNIIAENHTIITNNYPSSLSLGSKMQIVTAFDGNVLTRHLGAYTFSDGLSYSAYAIPEPSALLLSALGGLALLRRRR